MLEICVDSVQSAINAESGGADRIELCSSLCLGGLTPSAGLLRAVKKNLRIPVFCMIRPRQGDFVYDDLEKEVMLQDLKILKQYGADGFVTGFLNKNKNVEVDACRWLLHEADPLPVTFHRAFDVSDQWQDNLRKITGMGFQCILSSGLAKDAYNGRDILRIMNEIAPNKIMVGCGVNESNLRILCQETGSKIYHASASEALIKESNSISMGSMDDAPLKITTAGKVKALRTILDDYFAI